jgi:HEAT repeat protein
VRRAAIEAMQHRDMDMAAPILADLIRCLETDPSDHCRAACARTLASLDPPVEAVAPFKDALLGRLLLPDTTEAPTVRLAALTALARLPLPSLREGTPPLLETLLRAGLAHEEAAIRSVTLELLGSLPLDAGVAPQVDVIVQRVVQRREPDAAVRALALEALLGLPSQLLSPECVAVVQAAARGDSVPRVRQAAGRVLRSWS